MNSQLWIFEIITIIVNLGLLFIVLRFFSVDKKKFKKIFLIVISVLLILFLFYSLYLRYISTEVKMQNLEFK
jgi:heme O synthase-like polyprenyltransferase